MFTVYSVYHRITNTLPLRFNTRVGCSTVNFCAIYARAVVIRSSKSSNSGFLSLEVYTVLRESNFHSQSEVISRMTSTPRWRVLHPMWSLFEIAHCVSRFFPKDKSQDMCAQTSAFYWEHVVSCDSSIISPPSKLYCILHSLLSGSKPASSSSKGMEEHPQERVGDNEAASLTIGCAVSSQEDQHCAVLTGEWQQESLWCSSCCVL